MKKTTIITVILSFLIILASCGTPQSTEGSFDLNIFDPTEKIKLQQFNSVDELQTFLQTANRVNGNTALARTTMANDIAVESLASVSVPGKSQNDFSETNVQVQGVDEADIIKTDGDYIYTTSGKTVFIIKAYPSKEAEVIKKIELENHINGLFIQDNQLVVIHQNYNSGASLQKSTGFFPRYSSTVVKTYDISEKTGPVLQKTLEIEGSYFQARMLDNYVYIITRNRPNRIQPLPIILEDDSATKMDVANIFYYNKPYHSPEYNIITAVELGDKISYHSTAITTESSHNMYMSKNNMYITYTEHIREWDIQKKEFIEFFETRADPKTQELIQKIKKTDDDVLSQQEKEQKIYTTLQQFVSGLSKEQQSIYSEQLERKIERKLSEFEYFEYTIIHKLSVDGKNVKLQSTGKVPGHIINQFAMDEKDEVLRIATTVNGRFNRETSQRTEETNHVFTLSDDLQIMDSLNDLAPGERIFSTRFIDDRLYMVTFEQVDPFFVFDLSDERNIKELGKLKIPGFSRYLHPYDDNTIIGIGRDATDEGRQLGLKISLFDVTDVSNPKETAKFVTKEKYTSSIAEYEHKAFLFSKEKNLLVIPAYSYVYRNEEGQSYNGAMVFDITKNSVELKGIIDHSVQRIQKAEKAYRYYYQPRVERSLYIEELLYTKSSQMLRINQLEDLSAVKTIDLLENDDYEIILREDI